MTENAVQTPSAPEQRTMRPNKLGTSFLLLAALGFTAFGVWLFLRFHAPLAWTIIFVGLLLAGGLLFWLTPNAAYLELNREGLRFHYLFGQSKFRWRELRGFRVGRGPRGNPAAYYIHVTPDMVRVAMLPDCFGLTAQELVDLLEEYRMHFDPKPAIPETNDESNQ